MRTFSFSLGPDVDACHIVSLEELSSATYNNLRQKPSDAHSDLSNRAQAKSGMDDVQRHHKLTKKGLYYKTFVCKKRTLLLASAPVLAPPSFFFAPLFYWAPSPCLNTTGEEC